jgi:hypothetical protein
VGILCFWPNWHRIFQPCIEISRNFLPSDSVPFIVKPARVFHWFIRGLAVAFFASVIVARAEQAGFISSLSAEDKTISGITRLTEQQVAALEQQVLREIAVARQGATVAFASTFTHRRTPVERTQAGLDRLTTPELAQLDRLVAAALANHPPPTSPQATASEPYASPSSYVQVVPRKMEIHGEMSLTYMSGSGGRQGYGASMFTTATDPSGKFSLTVGLSQFYGKGFRGYPYYYPYDYDCDRGW